MTGMPALSFGYIAPGLLGRCWVVMASCPARAIQARLPSPGPAGVRDVSEETGRGDAARLTLRSASSASSDTSRFRFALACSHAAAGSSVSSISSISRSVFPDNALSGTVGTLTLPQESRHAYRRSQRARRYQPGGDRAQPEQAIAEAVITAQVIRCLPRPFCR